MTWTHRFVWSWLGAVLLGAVLATATPISASAQDDERSLTLIDIHQGGGLSDLVQFLSNGGYELSGAGQDGTPAFQSFGPWYNTYWRNFTLGWLLQLDQDDGITFGLSTGEHGEKYTIQPSVELGLIKQWHPRSNATLSLSLSTNLWGHLSESTCTGDYGDGPVLVNCRLAADPISPSASLNYLLNQDPSRLVVRLTYSVDF